MRISWISEADAPRGRRNDTPSPGTRHDPQHRFGTTAEAQGFVGQIGRFYDDGGWTLYRVGLSRGLVGPVGLTYHGDYMTRVGDGEGAFAGAGLDLTAFRTGAQGPYAVLGVGGGLGSPHSKSFSSLWTTWSAGAGYDLLPAPFLTFGGELRWREISLDHRGGLELAAGLGLRFGTSRPGGKAPARQVAPFISPSVRTPLRMCRCPRPRRPRRYRSRRRFLHPPRPMARPPSPTPSWRQQPR